MRRRFQLGDSIRGLAFWAGVSRRSVALALTGETHAHVGGPLRPIEDRRQPAPLTPAEREIIVLLWCEGRSLLEIAACVGRRDPRAIRRVLRAAAAAMREKLDAAQVTVPPPPTFMPVRRRRRG